MKTPIRSLIAFCLLTVWLAASLPWEALHMAMEHVTLADAENDERDGKENERSQKENERNQKEKEDKEFEPYDKDFVHSLHGISIYDALSKRWNLGHDLRMSNHVIEIQVPPPQTA